MSAGPTWILIHPRPGASKGDPTEDDILEPTTRWVVVGGGRARYVHHPRRGGTSQPRTSDERLGRGRHTSSEDERPGPRTACANLGRR